MNTAVPPSPPSGYFDQAARARIRHAMLRYMQDNRIGTPKLRDLIVAANGMALRRDGKDPIALSTVQRFIAGTHRANDSFVGLCARFAEGLPDDDPVAAFGDQIAAFLGIERGAENYRPLPPEIAGSYTCRTEMTPVGKGKLRLDPQPDDRHLVPFSDMVIEPLPDRPFATIRETITNWTASIHGSAESSLTSHPRRSYDGVLVYPNGQLLALMRDALWRTPRIYWLTRADDDRLIGDGREPLSWLDAASNTGDSWYTNLRITAIPVQEATDD